MEFWSGKSILNLEIIQAAQILFDRFEIIVVEAGHARYVRRLRKKYRIDPADAIIAATTRSEADYISHTQNFKKILA